uniref:Uncharacterized protein n=1 Tax=Octactis speculum TaxID=3111310 RepID=A0A7S2CDQ2_9STRA
MLGQSIFDEHENRFRSHRHSALLHVSVGAYLLGVHAPVPARHFVQSAAAVPVLTVPGHRLATSTPVSTKLAIFDFRTAEDASLQRSTKLPHESGFVKEDSNSGRLPLGGTDAEIRAAIG